MCLVAIAHDLSPHFPLILAANRDEDYERATHDAHRWSDRPDVVGGTDALHCGTWLAAAAGGRFAAVTNLRGATRRTRSRGFLVRDFVTGTLAPEEYAADVARDAEEYAGFHLLAGQISGSLMYIAPDQQMRLARGIHAFSNAPRDEEWPKVEIAASELRRRIAFDDAGALAEELLRFLSTPRGTGSVESEVFIPGDRYGTRSSSVIVATATEIVFDEQTYTRGGVATGERRTFRLAR